ncbi:hypothetical protein CAPTEDRAFT_130410, partial [Capitella teleta]
LNNESHLAESSCPLLWDGVMCWPLSKPGTIVQPCPNYINRFNVSAFATKHCEADGEWRINPQTNYSWTNFSGCISHENEFYFQDHIPKIHIIFSVGYGLSLITLLAAVILMSLFKKLRCPRTTLHVHLFVSFIVRAAVSFLKENLFVGGVGLEKDVIRDPLGNIEFIPNGTYWECKLLYVLSLYVISANCMWIFVEGLYLHMLIFMSVFSENSSVKSYIIFGWASPLVFILPWIAVRATLDDVMCWNTATEAAYWWIVRAPVTAAMAINFVFFLNILRVLFTKLKASNTPEARKFRYRKLAKSTLVLIPLYGVHYVVFIWIEPTHVSDLTQVVWLYFEMTFNSFQGFFIAMLFCFLNGEVQSEIKKKWQRYQLSRDSAWRTSNRSNVFNTTTTFANSRFRTSRTPSLNLDGGSSRRNSSSPKVQKLNGIFRKPDRSRSNTRSRSNSRTECEPLTTDIMKQNKRPEEIIMITTPQNADQFK